MLEDRVLILMPTLKDAERSSRFLSEEGVVCAICHDMHAMCHGIEEGAGVALIAEEFVSEHHEELVAILEQQPRWSDFPLVILARDKVDDHSVSRRTIMNVSLVERPVRFRSLLSVIQSALRSRRRQYEVRDHLAEHERQAAELREKEERLQFALVAGRLGSWELNLETMEVDCSDIFKANFGHKTEGGVSSKDLFDAIHPDDRARVQVALNQAIEQRIDYDVEYRAVWPDSTIHWLMVRGKTKYNDGGVPVRMTGISLDVTDRHRQEEALRESGQKKDEFLALLAHELRNPLAPIRNGLQVSRLSQDPVVRKNVQEMMERQLGHMVRLIDDLLDISRLNRNKMELRIARIALAEVIRSAVETARPMIDECGHDLRIELPDEPILLNGDLTRLAQVFSNLLINSAKYTDRCGRIELVARRQLDEIVVFVRDNGIGIPAHALSQIFDMFSQVDRTMERTMGGLGIGLALVKGLVEMHRGTIAATSAGPGTGSTFTVRLPLAEVRSEAKTKSPPETDGHTVHRQRILVVDDNLDSARSMAQMLHLVGHEVSMAHNGEQAVQQAQSFRPAIILMDLGMPHLNGLDATRQIRKASWGREMIILALTGWGQDGDRERSQAAGCNGHLVKPVAWADLERVLATAQCSPSDCESVACPVGTGSDLSGVTLC